MKIFRSFLATMLLATLVLGMIAPTIALAIPAPGIQVPTDPGDPVVTAAGDPVDGTGSGIKSMPPIPISLPALVVWLNTRLYGTWLSTTGRMGLVKSTVSSMPSTPTRHGSLGATR